MTKADRVMESLNRFMDGDAASHIAKKKRRMVILFGLAALLIAVSIIVGLYVGPTSFRDVDILETRLPRLLAAIGVGIGLSVAGAAYQAVIRNPLVDPYIMGVSSGAGTMAIAVISFNFTFFGLLSIHSPYTIAIAAIFGGLLAFGCTMALTKKAGGTTNAYVLSGVIVGLIFGAIQTILLVFSGDNVSNSLLWLFGSFKDVTWTHVPFIIIPTIIIAAVILRYSKELNLILLGEDQATQMGLNVKRFNALILIVASILTAFCVAFVGIIGFVGLVVPHLCRMIFGGDHRLVLPASIAMGGFLMVMADLLARMILIGQELPVGAITTLIGVPVFAYLLMKRGKMYNG